jgi:predicted nuclease of predicted toxin-antitoxin system
MLSFLSDENFNGDIIRGLFLRQPNLDLLRVQDVGLQEVDDPIILEWATINNRILLTHDRATMPDFAYERLNKGEDMAGMFVINDRMPNRQVIDELILLVDCSEQTEWKDVILYLPL